MKIKFYAQLVLFSMLILITCPSMAQVDEVSASVDKNTALLDESIRLTVIITGDAERNDIDFSPLQKDFRVSQPSFSQSTQIINGDVTRSISWTVNLYPKKSGQFEIPSFTVKGKQSQAFTINILPADAVNTNRPREFYVTATIDNDNIYLQQQILYKVQIHLARDIQRGQLRLPELEGAVIEQIGEDEDFQEIIDGVRYRIIERSYAIIPQASGNFTITGPIFDAQVSTDSRQSFANFGRTTTISRRAPDIEIDVKPIPNNYNYTWLPSELVEVNEEWQGNGQSLMVGEPLTRTITLTALGLTKEQLPELDLPYHPSFKIYPEQAQLTTVEHNNSLIAQGVYNSAIIPEQAGNFVLPEVRIPWFNVNTGQTEFAVVPARNVEVLPNTAAGEPNNSQQASNTQQQASQEIDFVPSGNDQAQQAIIYILVFTNVASLLLIVFMFRKQKNKPMLSTQSQNADPMTTAQLSEEQSFKQVKYALEQGKTETLSLLLNTWLSTLLGKQHYSISASLALFPDSHALDFYNTFLSTKYSSQDAKPNFSGFISALQDYRKGVLKQQNTGILAALYPTT